jgi:hypothetical protein
MAAARKPAAKTTTQQTVTFMLDRPSPKKHSVRFEGSDNNLPVSSIYLTNAAHAQLGNPTAITITIAAANNGS